MSNDPQAIDLSTRLGELLRDHRRAAGLTQEELAERAGVSPRSISELERGGAHIPRRDTIALLSGALGLQGTAREDFEALVAERRRARVPLEQAKVEPRVHTVPRSLTPLIGRERDLEQLAAVLGVGESALLTLVGPGGVGKSRLAEELVRANSARFRHGCWFVELGGLDDASLLAAAVATAVGLEDLRSRGVVDSLLDYLEDRQLLLILDNCEHLVEPCAELAGLLLTRCPQLHILASSREPLNIPGEVVRRVLPLELPDASRLFVERARAADQSFELTAAASAAVARICVGLDGIPLALELAAARSRTLSIEQLADRLEHDNSLLVASTRTRLPQHRTMRAALDWSHELLSPDEQMLLRRLAVFAGGWSLSNAEQICSGDGLETNGIFELLTQLVDKSMVQVDVRQANARYRLLQPVRQYAAERLEASGEAVVYRARHCDAMFRLVFAQQAGGPGPDEIGSLDRLEHEHDNLRAALRWALTHKRTIEALRCTAALFRFWERRGHFQEGCAWHEQALASAPQTPSPERSWALNSLAFLYWRGGDVERALPAAQQALSVSRTVGLPRDVAQAHLNLGMIAYIREQSELALAHLEESVSLAREGGLPPQLSLALTFLGRARLWVYGPFDDATLALLEEGLAVAQKAESHYSTGHALVTLGDLLWGRHDTDGASRLWREALIVRSELTDRRGIAGCLERLAKARAAHQQFEVAAWLFGAADAQHRALGIRLRHDEATDHERLVAHTRQILGDAFEPEWSAGFSAGWEYAVQRALSDIAS